jgi:hypothetical protein
MVEREERKLFFVNFAGTFALSMVSVLSFKGLFSFHDLVPIALIMVFGFITSYFRVSEKIRLTKYLRNALIVFVFIMGIKWIVFDKRDINFTLCEVLLWTTALSSYALSKGRDYIIMRWMAVVGVTVSSVFVGSLVNMRPFSMWMIGLSFFILVILLRTDFVRERFRYLSFVCEEKECKNVVGQLLIGGTFTSFCLVSALLAYIMMPRAEYVIYKAVPSYLPSPEDKAQSGNPLSWESNANSDKSSGYLYIQPQELTVQKARPIHLKAFYLHDSKYSNTRTVTNFVEWFVKDPAIAGISGDGVLKGKNPGATMVRCVYKTGDNAAISEPINLFMGLSSIEVKPAIELMEEGTTQKITAEGTFENGKKIDLTDNVTWELDENCRKKGLAFMLSDGSFSSRKSGIIGIRARKGSDGGEQDMVKSPTAYVIVTKPYGGLFKDGTGGSNEMLFSSSHPGYWGMMVYDKYNGANWSVSCQALSDLTRKANKFYTKQKFSKSAAEDKVLVNCTINKDMQGVIPLFGTRVEEIILPEISENVLKSDFNDNIYVVPEFTLSKGISFQELVPPQDKNLPDFDFPILNFRAYPHFVLKNYTALPEDVSAAVRRKAEEILKKYKTSADALNGIDDFIFNACVVGRVAETPKGIKDVAEYVLFSGKPCSIKNLATAQVVMYRIAGIPSRLVEGVYSFSRDPKTGLYDVYANSSAAWPQIYLKDTGWVDRFSYKLHQKITADEKKTQEEAKKNPDPQKTGAEKAKSLSSIDVKVVKLKENILSANGNIQKPSARPQVFKEDLQETKKGDLTAYVGDKLKFSLVKTFADGHIEEVVKGIKWYNSNAEVVFIDKDDTVVVKKKGAAIVKGFIADKESFPLIITSFTNPAEARKAQVRQNAIMKFIVMIMPALSAIAMWFIGMYLFVVIKKRAIEHMIKSHPEKAIKVFYRHFVIRMKSCNFVFNETATQLEISEIVLKKNPDLETAVSAITSNYLEAVFGGYKMSSIKAYESFNCLQKVEEYMRAKLTFIEKIKSKALFAVISVKKSVKR